MLKIALLSGVLAVAALNFLHVRRHFYVGNQEQTDLELLRRRVWVELLMIALTIGATSALTLSPPPNVVPLPTVLVHESDGLRVGPAHFTVQIRSHNGQPVTDHVQRVMLEFRQSNELGAVSVIAKPTSAGTFVAEGSAWLGAGRSLYTCA